MNMNEFITIITLVAAVLNICLFFKLWGMCNNVRRFAYKLERKLDKDLGLDKKKDNTINEDNDEYVETYDHLGRPIKPKPTLRV